MSTTPFLFLSFPPEIRNLIYNTLLTPTNIAKVTHPDVEKLPQTTYQFSKIISLLSINKQIRSEALPIFYRNFAFVRVATAWDEAISRISEAGNVPIVNWGRRAQQFQGWSLSMNIKGVGLGGGYDDNDEDDLQHVFVILGQDVLKFARMWMFSDLTSGAELNFHLAVEMCFRDPVSFSTGGDEGSLPVAVQRRLVEPFGLLKRLHSVQFTGAVEESVETGLRAKMAEEEPSPEECLEKGNTYKDEGNALLKAGKLQEAIAMYTKAFEAIHIICVGRYRGVWADHWFDRILTGDKFNGMHGQVVRIILRTRLVANIVRTYLDMGEYEEARYWGERTINLVSGAMGLRGHQPILSFPAATEMGKIYYRTGMAMKALDRLEDAKEYLKAAEGYLPHDETVKRELANLSPRLYLG